MPINTIYEVDKSESKRFYAVERAGFTEVGGLSREIISDMIFNQWFTVIHSKLTDTNNFVMPTPEWPPQERLIEIVNPGVGFAKGNYIEYPLPAGPNVKLVLGNVDPLTGGVDEFTVVWPGNYYSNAVVKANPSVGNYAVNKNTPLAPKAGATKAFESYADSIKVWGNVTNTVGAALSDQVPSTQNQGDEGPQTWNTEYGINSATNPPLGGTKGRKTQTTGIWFVKKTPIGSSTNVDINANVYIGQTVTFDPTQPKSKTSTIPAGTKVVNYGEFQYLAGVKSNGNGNNPEFLEYTATGVWLVLDQPVVINMKDTLIFKGINSSIYTANLQYPKAWQTIVEAGGAVDPINDPYGVEAEVVATTTNSRYVRVTAITTVANYPAEIYPGQAVTSTQTPGSIGADAVYVESVTMETSSIANVKLSMPKSIPASEGLRFIFDQLQPWRMAFQILENTTNPTVGPQTLNILAATDIQLQNNGNVANIWLGNTTGTGSTATTTFAQTDKAGIMGDLPTGASGTVNNAFPSQGFLNRTTRVGTDPEAYPLNYGLTMTERGIFLGLWEGTWSTLQKKKAFGQGGDNFFNWLLIQRPVDRYTGKTLTKGRCPVFCINSVGYRYWKFIVREEDVLHPSIGDKDNVRETWDYANSKIISESVRYRVPADANTQDSFAILNTTNQVALTEDSKYLVSFLHNLATPRFRYSEELDLIGQTSADVCMAGNEISINAYNETGNRVYRALPANNPYNTGLRIAVLKDIP